jgi:hypothetical protein
MHQNEIIVLTMFLIILYIQPYPLVRYTNTIIGRIILITALVLASLHSIFAGVLIAMTIVLLTHTKSSDMYEGMEGNVTNELLDSTTEKNKYDNNDVLNTKSGNNIIGDTQEKPVGNAITDLPSSSSIGIIFSNIPSNSNFRKNHCKSKDSSSRQIFVDENGKEMNIENIKKKYLLNFKNDIDCNPCDESCTYTISDSVEQIHNEEILRPKQSSMFM